MLIGLLVPRFARRTANGERQRAQPLLRDLDVTLHALSVLARLDPAEGLVETAERVRLTLEEREVDGILGAHLRVVADVTHLACSAGAPIPALKRRCTTPKSWSFSEAVNLAKSRRSRW